VFSGGVALGAYQAGAYAVLHDREEFRPGHLAGSSIGAVNAAIIAGNPPERRVERLRGFWEAVASRPEPLGAPWPGLAGEGPWRHAHSWLSVVQTRLLGQAGVFRPRLGALLPRGGASLYDHAPLRANLERFVDFGRLNDGAPRLSVVATDVETGEAVVFDTHKGDRIGADHLLASCGFLPDFPPLEIGGRLLGDGGFAANAPVEAVLPDEGGEDDLLCFVIDLFSPEGERPTSLEEAATRRMDLMFGNQSRQRLEGLEREFRLRRALGRLAATAGAEAASDPDLAPLAGGAGERAVTVLHLRYRAPAHEAGPERSFDFSKATLDNRWKAGARDMAEAIRLAGDGPPPEGMVVCRVPRKGRGRAP